MGCEWRRSNPNGEGGGVKSWEFHWLYFGGWLKHWLFFFRTESWDNHIPQFKSNTASTRGLELQVSPQKYVHQLVHPMWICVLKKECWKSNLTKNIRFYLPNLNLNLEKSTTTKITWHQDWMNTSEFVHFWIHIVYPRTWREFTNFILPANAHLCV